MPALETIHVDIWTPVVPAASYTPQIIWSNVTSPDPRLWNATKMYGVSMNLTFSNATVYSVRNNRYHKWRPVARRFVSLCWCCRQPSCSLVCSARRGPSMRLSRLLRPAQAAGALRCPTACKCSCCREFAANVSCMFCSNGSGSLSSSAIAGIAVAVVACFAVLGAVQAILHGKLTG